MQDYKNNIIITENQSNALSIIRSAAMVAIVLCHIFQVYASKWAWFFNIGVQIFLFMSGFLYGHKIITNFTLWFKQRVLKIYIPFIVFSILSILAYKFFSNTLVNIKDVLLYILDIQGVTGGVYGLDHLWFLTAIAACYLITPILQKLRKYAFSMLPLILLIGLLQFYFIEKFENVFSWLFLYSIGYFFAIVNPWQRALFAFATIILSLFTIKNLEWSMLINDTIESLRFHVFGGSIIFITAYYLLQKISYGKYIGTIKIIDRYSFYIYITHHVFIIGAFSLANITDSRLINIWLILIASISAALLLKKLSDLIVKYIIKIGK